MAFRATYAKHKQDNNLMLAKAACTYVNDQEILWTCEVTCCTSICTVGTNKGTFLTQYLYCNYMHATSNYEYQLLMFLLQTTTPCSRSPIAMSEQLPGHTTGVCACPRAIRLAASAGWPHRRAPQLAGAA